MWILILVGQGNANSAPTIHHISGFATAEAAREAGRATVRISHNPVAYTVVGSVSGSEAKL